MNSVEHQLSGYGSLNASPRSNAGAHVVAAHQRWLQGSDHNPKKYKLNMGSDTRG
jgi:hypothetical protein